MGLLSLLGKIVDVKRGLTPILGKTMTLARERMRSRKLRRKLMPEERAKHEMMAGREKGNISKVKKGTKKLVRIIHSEDRLIFQIFDGEEKVEYDLVKDIERCEGVVNQSRATNKEAVMKRIRAIAKTFESLAELELGKMAYLQKGGKPWEGVANIASYSIGTTINVVLGEAVNQRSMVVATKGKLNLVAHFAGKIYNEMRAKAPRADRIKQYMAKQEDALKKLEDVVNRQLMSSFKLQFYCILRLLDFARRDIEQGGNLIETFKKEGFPEGDARKIEKWLTDELHLLEKRESTEVKKLAIIAGEGARAA